MNLISHARHVEALHLLRHEMSRRTLHSPSMQHLRNETLQIPTIPPSTVSSGVDATAAIAANTAVGGGGGSALVSTLLDTLEAADNAAAHTLVVLEHRALLLRICALGTVLGGGEEEGGASATAVEVEALIALISDSISTVLRQALFISSSSCVDIRETPPSTFPLPPHTCNDPVCEAVGGAQAHSTPPTPTRTLSVSDAQHLMRVSARLLRMSQHILQKDAGTAAPTKMKQSRDVEKLLRACVGMGMGSADGGGGGKVADGGAASCEESSHTLVRDVFGMRP